MTSVAAPPLKRGWLRKQARSGLVKNWQVRYFVLNQGKLSYYQEQLDRFPYGDILKVREMGNPLLNYYNDHFLIGRT